MKAGEAPLTGEALDLFNNLNERAKDPRFIYSCKEDAEGVGLEIAKDALDKACIKSLLSDTVEPVLRDDFKVDAEGNPVYTEFLSTLAVKAERDELYHEYEKHLGDTVKSLASADIEAGFIADDDAKADFWGIISAESISTTIKLDPSDSRYGVHGVDFDDSVPETIALDAANYFSTIQPESDGGFEADHLKDIGVVVYRCYLDSSEGNKVSYEPVEAFCGSLCKDDKDPNTGVTKFIDTIVNTNSEYINFFSNCFNDKTNKKFYRDECDILIAEPCQGAVLGLYSPMTKEDISISKSIYDGLNKAFEKIEDINKL